MPMYVFVCLLFQSRFQIIIVVGSISALMSCQLSVYRHYYLPYFWLWIWYIWYFL